MRENKPLERIGLLNPTLVRPLLGEVDGMRTVERGLRPRWSPAARRWRAPNSGAR